MTEKPQAKLSRRKLMAGLAVGAAGLGAVATSALNRTWFSRDGRGVKSWWDRQFTSLDRAGMNEWTRQIGADFEVRDAGSATAFKLVAVKPLQSEGARPDNVSRDRAFAAIFDAGAAARLEGDRIYDVRHGKGEMKVYFSAADPTAATSRLEAVFN